MDANKYSNTASEGQKHILIAEDDRYLAGGYKVKLEKEGYAVSVAGDGQETLRLARLRKPQLILLDLIMPVKDGFQTLKELKEDPSLSYIPVLVLSNLGQEQEIKRALSLGAVGYLVKTETAVLQLIHEIQKYLL